MPIVIAAFYQFEPIANPDAARAALHDLAVRLDLKGTMIVAGEGINATLAGAEPAIETFLSALQTGLPDLPAMTRLELKRARAECVPFGRLKVKHKPEIVTLGAPEADPKARVGVHVAPEDWNALLNDPDIVLIDTRNQFEVALGSFAHAIDPGTKEFSAFPDFVARELGAAQTRKVAMFCTGGIRCEKATALLLARGFEPVFHLKGGILAYLETVPPAQSRWRGECFVFDAREMIS